MEHSEAYEFLRRQRLGVVSSVGPDGAPQSALMGVAVTPGLEIVFDTVRGSRKYRNMVARPACSLVLGWEGEQTVQMEGMAFEPSGEGEQTVQMEGMAFEPSGEALERYQEVYFAAWPECRSHLAWPDVVHLVVRPGWLRFSDYDVRPPRIEEIWFAS